MDFITNMASCWCQTFLVGIVIYLVALIGATITAICTAKGHLISAAIMALISGCIAQFGKIVTIVGVILAILQVILNFI